MAKAYQKKIQKWGNLLALFQEDPIVFLKKLNHILIRNKNLKEEDIEAFIRKRDQARKNQNWEEADSLREQLNKMGIEVHDSAEKSTWEAKELC